MNEELWEVIHKLERVMRAGQTRELQDHDRIKKLEQTMQNHLDYHRNYKATLRDEMGGLEIEADGEISLDFCPCGTGCEVCGGVPNQHWEAT